MFYCIKLLRVIYCFSFYSMSLPFLLWNLLAKENAWQCGGGGGMGQQRNWIHNCESSVGGGSFLGTPSLAQGAARQQRQSLGSGSCTRCPISWVQAACKASGTFQGRSYSHPSVLVGSAAVISKGCSRPAARQSLALESL